MFKHCVFLSLLCLSATNVLPVFAQDDDAVETKSESAYATSKTDTARSLAMKGQFHMRHGFLDQAIKEFEQAVVKDPDDADFRQFYAEALQKKLETGDPRQSPELLAECVRQWVTVLRNDVGDDKEARVAGFSLGGVFNDEGRQIAAKRNLVRLVGSAPKVWETNQRYLNRVLGPSEMVVAGKMLNKKSVKGSANTEKDADTE